MTHDSNTIYIDVCHLPTNGAMMLPTLAHIEAEPSPTLRTLMNMSSPLYIAKSIKWKKVLMFLSRELLHKCHIYVNKLQLTTVGNISAA